MTTTLSSKGQIVLPAAARKRLGLRPGTRFECHVQGDRIVLERSEKNSGSPRFVKSKLTGLVVTEAPGAAPKVDSAQVREMLADFP